MCDCVGCVDCAFVTPQTELVYEIHITVDNNENFIDDCYEFGIKPVIINMGDEIPEHVMTSSTVKGNDANAHAAASNFANLFRSKGYEVKRVKIETVPWHPEASRPKSSQYFETHFAISLPCDEKKLKFWADNLGLHYSRNRLKQGEASVQMLTYRNYNSLSSFDKNVKSIKGYLEYDGFKIAKVIQEFALYDSNVDLDQQWLNKEKHV